VGDRSLAPGESAAQLNRQAIEARFADDISPLLRPRDVLASFSEVFSESNRFRWTLAGIALLFFGWGVLSYFMYRPAGIRYTVDDIRQIDEILAFILVELGFRAPVRKGANLFYRPRLATLLWWGPISFTARIDGTSVVVIGPALFLTRLKRALSAFEERARRTS
jgi:hypothetical protein